MSISTNAIHADDHIYNQIPDVAPPLRVSTTFEYPEGYDPINGEPDLCYSRHAHPNTTRAEQVLTKILGNKTVLYSSGLSAFHGAVASINPRRVMIATQSYSGCHGILQFLNRNYGIEVFDFDADPNVLKKGDLIHVESPVNPYGVARDIQKYAEIAHSRGALLMVDATFAPPPLSDPFKQGADIVMHSGTKYFGGHSDILAGTLSFEDDKLHRQALEDRLLLGTICSTLDSWLLLRSLRTYEMRILKQSENAKMIVDYLVNNKHKLPLLDKVYHSSLQTQEFVKEQLTGNGPPCFSITLTSRDAAKHASTKLKVFKHCTSLGGVESTIEWRLISEPDIDPTLVRISTGCENPDDLIEDLSRALY